MMARDGEKRVVVLGALSAIAEATARLYAAEGARLVHAGRNAERLVRVSADLGVRGAVDSIPWPIDLAATMNPSQRW
jgi:NADP-dependent 3-hydroxy acid dehydrogenase YdfG